MNNEVFQILEIIIPPGFTGGEHLTVQGPDGRYFDAVIPENSIPGTTLRIQVPNFDPNVSSSETNSDLEVNDEEEKKDDEYKPKQLSTATKATAGFVLGSLLLGPLISGMIVAGTFICIRKSDTVVDSPVNEEEEELKEESTEPLLPKNKFLERVEKLDKEHRITDRISSIEEKNF